MTVRPDPRLDPDERALAVQLARIAPRGEPSAELDARILSMAGAGAPVAAAVPASRRGTPARWPVWMGVAASLTAVAGLVWRLQPVLQPSPPVRYEAPAAVAADADPNGQRQPVEYVTADAAAAPAMPPPASAAATTESAVAAPAPARPSAAAPIPPASVAVVQATEAAPAAPPPVPSPARAAHADEALVQEVPRRAVPETLQDAVRSPASVAEPSARQRALSAPTPTAEPPPVAAAAAEGPPGDRPGFDARPPATADTPEMQRAWIARIRELRDAGQLDDARASLKAFSQRFPKAAIPADLKPLLAPASEP